ncbi:hypothetical protein CORT_0A10650 [Candida orthopsilosis Co 90-125]|uniref:Uncharacterized protein n=1 Tax=Candida orthopsilosis (strain 90-125) TaxID=1136231 RepID=H8WXE5_CANO9|nr:hypothetical protein CORT_0A10650 [Candida orthopsilosis Co 90-125]CCG21451.1 hypothetical protein CORT_0A10650 [Candida orthopsilosis Co 90-125]
MTEIDEKIDHFEGDSNRTMSPRLDSNMGSVFDTPKPPLTSSTLGTSPQQAEPDKLKAHDAQIRLKQELIEEKQRLLKIKADKLNRIETLQTRVEQLSKLQQESNVKTQLNELLQKSQVEFYKNLRTRNQKQEKYMLQHLNVLPSPDWDLRLSLAKQFIPFLDIDKLKTYNEYVDDKLVRVFQFTILSPLVLNLTLKLEINTSNDSVYQMLVMTNLKTLRMLSSSFTTALINDYIPNGKINCVMYGLNSLTKLIQKRTRIWHQLIVKHKSLIASDRLVNIPDEVSDYKKLYANLKSVESIDLIINNYKVSLYWSITNNDHLTGSCQSDLQLYITQNGTTTLKNAGSLFTSLVPRYGIINSLEIILCNVFNY